ncbi:MAG: hypothetical protein ACYTBZ_14265 [Planctomycetota bacterium]|jgi:hypothetical protein
MYDDPKLLTQAKLDAIHAIFMASFIMLLCLTAFLIGLTVAPYFGPYPQYVFIIIGIVLAWLALWTTKHGLKRMSIARAYEKRYNAEQQYIRSSKAQVKDSDLYKFFLSWDRKEFGVNVEDVSSILRKNNKDDQQDAPAN